MLPAGQMPPVKESLSRLSVEQTVSRRPTLENFRIISGGYFTMVSGDEQSPARRSLAVLL